MPSLTFILPHWLYWVGLLLFPFLAMYLVRRERRFRSDGAVSIPLAYLFLLGGGYVGLHRFYARNLLGIVYIPLFLTILFANDSAGATTWDAGLLVGYRLGGGVLNLDLEIDVVTHGGEAASRLAGAGASPGNNQLGEVWPENWSVTKDRSYGLTVRLGVPVTPFGAEAFAFAGARRLDAEYRTSYTGCPIVGGCRADQLLSNAERHEQRFDAFTAGLGVEQEVAGIVLRAELRYTDYGKTNHITPFEDLFVTVPWELESGETGVGLSVLWRP